MPRWEPQTEDRLRDAALDLFRARGYDAVTVEEIAERAGVTRRTFFRYFGDKRDVLFDGADEFLATFGNAVVGADAALPAWPALEAGFLAVGAFLQDRSARAGDRRDVIAASAELRERERSKLADMGDAAASALCRRGVDAATASLLAQAAIPVFSAAFEAWTDRPDPAGFAAHLRAATAALADALTPGAAAPGPPHITKERTL